MSKDNVTVLEQEYDLDDVYEMTLDEQDEYSTAVAKKVEEILAGAGKTVNDVVDYRAVAKVKIIVEVKELR